MVAAKDQTGNKCTVWAEIDAFEEERVRFYIAGGVGHRYESKRCARESGNGAGRVVQVLQGGSRIRHGEDAYPSKSRLLSTLENREIKPAERRREKPMPFTLDGFCFPRLTSAIHGAATRSMDEPFGSEPPSFSWLNYP